MIAVTRRYEIPAAHVLANPKLSDTENDEIFGKCANPAGHGHNYGLEITVTGPVDPERGQIVPPDLLDEIFREAITERYSHTMLNATRGFEDCVPTTENFAKVVFDAHLSQQSAGHSRPCSRQNIFGRRCPKIDDWNQQGDNTACVNQLSLS